MGDQAAQHLLSLCSEGREVEAVSELKGWDAGLQASTVNSQLVGGWTVLLTALRSGCSHLPEALVRVSICLQVSALISV